MQKPGELQKPVQAGNLRKDLKIDKPCPNCGLIVYLPSVHVCPLGGKSAANKVEKMAKLNESRHG